MHVRDANVQRVFTLSILILLLFEVSVSDLIVNTHNGPIEGVPSLEEGVEAFLGVPYAEPPVGELRFAKPVPKKNWQDVYKAEHFPPPCVQSSVDDSYYFLPDVTNMSEDCLYLNIWAPKSETINGLRPVVIYFHHGAFVTGSSSMKVHDGSHFSSRGDVIVVTVNYRLGALGFLVADIEEADGNMGMYDQVMAIKWVKKNAKIFSGDPENIVLMGVSAGAYSVSAHLVSPLSKNLFKKAIVQSGSLVNPFFRDNNPLYENSQLVASLVGCTNKNLSLKTDPKSVLKCLKGKPIEEFAMAEKILLVSNPFRFFPRMNDSFLPKTAGDLLREGNFRKDVSLLVGINDEEGSLFLIVGLREYFGKYGKNNLKMSKHRAAVICKNFGNAVRQTAPSRVADFYVNSVKNHTSIDYTKAVVNEFGDFLMNCNTVFLADFLSLNGSAVYFYKFGFRSPSTPLVDWAGVTHLDELQYVFGNPYHDNFTSEEIELSHRLIDRWSTFARTGTPNIAGHVPWLQYSYENPLYMNFGQEEESIRLKPSDRCDVWRKEFDSKFDSDSIQVLKNSAVYA